MSSSASGIVAMLAPNRRTRTTARGVRRDHAAAGVDDVGDVPHALLDAWAEQWLLQVADDSTRIIDVEETGTTL